MALWLTHPLATTFPKLFSSGDHFYQSECSTGHPTLVPFESKLFKILNYSVCYAIHVNFIFSVFFGTNVQSKRTTRAEPEDHLWSADHSLGNTMSSIYIPGTHFFSCAVCLEIWKPQPSGTLRACPPK
jgi:hypothetical protein